MPFDTDQKAQLAAKLDRSNVKERTMAGRKMSYVEGWHVIAEANRIFGFDGWTSETVLLQETNRELVELTGQNGKYSQWRIGYIAKVRITAGGVAREGTGYGSGMGKPEAVGDAVEGAIKEAETDARKRALMTFGSPFGLALYDKDQAEVENATSKPPKPAAAPSKQPGGEAYAPEHVKVPEPDQPATITPAKWLQIGIERVPTLDRKGLDEFTEKHHAKMAKVRALEPDLHAKLIKAIQDRQAELF